MRIAIDARALMEGRLSGVEEYTTRIIVAMAQVAPQHEYVLFYNAASPVTLPAALSRQVVEKFTYPNIFFNALQATVRWPKWDYLVSADCFFVPSFRLLPLTSRTPVVTTVHDLSFELFPEFFSAKRRLWHRLMQPQTLMRNSDHLIAVSEATARDLQEVYSVPAADISVIYSGIAMLPVTKRNAAAHVQKKYNLPHRFILYFGTLEPRKNISSIINAFSAIAHRVPHDLVIAGARGWMTSAIDDALRECSVRERIHLTGFVDEVDKWSMYAAADIFVYPSFYEGFGFPPLEALVSGTPVVTSHNSSLPEVVGEWATLVDPYQPAELAAVLEQLLSAPSIRITPTEQNKILATYSWQQAAQQTVACLEATV